LLATVELLVSPFDKNATNNVEKRLYMCSGELMDSNGLPLLAPVRLVFSPFDNKCNGHQRKETVLLQWTTAGF
jgi:hypothetical protein